MSEVKFFCPHCNQKIQCDDAWGAQKIQCPACQGELIVPQAQAAPSAPPPPVPAPPPAAAARPSAARPPASPRPGAMPSSVRAPLKPLSVHKPANKKMQAVKICVAVVAAGVGFYFGFGLVTSWQKKMNEKTAAVAKESNGGQLGHIADLYSVLDATDPNRYERTSRRRIPDSDAMAKISRIAMRGTNAAPDPEKSLPLLPAAWTLDLDAAKIPEGRANGTLGGTNFVVELARLEKNGQTYVLNVRQGAGAVADRELLIYLRLNPGENFPGHAWTVSKDMKGATVPQVIKRWKANPKYAPLQKMFGSGYVMKLEFGALQDDTVPAKIFIALPDTEQSVVAGAFRLTLGATITGGPAMAGDMADEK
jgi:hypothetical protein